jgi:Ca-activated chloride channel homolog
MSFRDPLLLLSLLLLPAAAAAWRLVERRRIRYAVRFTNLEVLSQVASGRAWRRYLPPSLFLLALAAVCLALARPSVHSLVPIERATVILVLDASGSMHATDVHPTRLGVAELAARGFLARAPKRLRVGVIVFAGEVHVAAPPTTDRALARAAVDSIGAYAGAGGTAIGDALAAAVRLGERAIHMPIGSRGLRSNTTAPPSVESGHLLSILFLSDGQQTAGALTPLQGAQRAKQAGIPVYAVALGTPNGRVGIEGFARTLRVPPDPKTLRALAKRTGGEFFAATSAAKAKGAYSKLGSSLGRKPGHTEVTFAFVAVAAGLLIGAGALSTLWSPKLP